MVSSTTELRLTEEPDDEDSTLARLRARNAALEQALERRSLELRLLLRHLCRRDLVIASRILAGLPPVPLLPHDPELWEETVELRGAEVRETMEDLWASLVPLSSGPTADGT